MVTHLWLRHEIKPMEHRAALSPDACQKLLNQGFKISVEKSSTRIFGDDEYEKVGCQLVAQESWETSAPSDAIIMGLKELPEATTSLKHTHLYFGHCFKDQTGWKELLKRFHDGKGTLLDLEFLQDDSGRRVAAFGYHAGFTGSAVGLDVWCHQKSNSTEPYPAIKSFPNQGILISTIKERLGSAKQLTGKLPKIMVMGAKGRCGGGAVDFAKALGIPEENIIGWDLAETAKGGPFSEILEADIFVNCIYLTQKIPSFLTLDTIKESNRNLSVLVDVSCDYTSPNNPVPVYNSATHFSQPTLKVPDSDVNGNPVLEVVAIDHLPTMLPREASQAFSNDLLPTLLKLGDRKNAPVWKGAEALFEVKVKEAGF